MAIPSYNELINMSDAEVVERYNSRAQNADAGAGFWRDELLRRSMAEHSRVIEKETRTLRCLTVIMTVLATISVVSAITAVIVAAGG